MGISMAHSCQEDIFDIPVTHSEALRPMRDRWPMRTEALGLVLLSWSVFCPPTSPSANAPASVYPHKDYSVHMHASVIWEMTALHGLSPLSKVSSRGESLVGAHLCK